MLECRYYGNCYFMECDVPDKCDGNGNCESHRHGHEIKTVCQFYSSMLDVESLLAIADEMEQAGKDYRYQMVENACCDNLIDDGPDDFIGYAARIRKALGVER